MASDTALRAWDRVRACASSTGALSPDSARRAVAKRDAQSSTLGPPHASHHVGDGRAPRPPRGRSGLIEPRTPPKRAHVAPPRGPSGTGSRLRLSLGHVRRRRLVTRIRASGARSSQARTTRAPCGRSCSMLCRTTSARRPRGGARPTAVTQPRRRSRWPWSATGEATAQRSALSWPRRRGHRLDSPEPRRCRRQRSRQALREARLADARLAYQGDEPALRHRAGDSRPSCCRPTKAGASNSWRLVRRAAPRSVSAVALPSSAISPSLSSTAPARARSR